MAAMAKEMKKTNKRRHDHDHLVENSRFPLATHDHLRYECKTCQKRFSTYQALGGHQGVHKKIKLEDGNNEPWLTLNKLEDGNNEPWLTLNISGYSKSLELHRCKLCMKGFATGQALGGHMRCHNRPGKGKQIKQEVKVESDLTMVGVRPLRVKVEEEDHDRFIARRDLILAAREWTLFF